MKYFVALAALAVLAVGCQSELSTAPEAATPEAATTVVFSVPGMMCEESCAKQVNKALAAQPGVKDVEVDFEARRAMVVVDRQQFDAQAAIATLVDYQFTNSKLVTDD
jgi:copper chaperone CopZ